MNHDTLFAYPPQYVRKAAHQILTYAIKAGLIIPPAACEKCHSQTHGRALDGHHLDYSKPLEVIWLCRSCHEKEHLPSLTNKKMKCAIRWLQSHPEAASLSGRDLESRVIIDGKKISYRWWNEAKKQITAD